MNPVTEFDRIKNAADFMFNSQAYVDIDLMLKMLGIPKIIIINVIEQCGYVKSDIENNYIKF